MIPSRRTPRISAPPTVEELPAGITYVKPKLTGNSVNDFTTPTVEELPGEHSHAYEALKKKSEEEGFQA